MADFNLKDDLLGFGRAQLKYMLFYNSTLDALTDFTHRRGLFFYDTDLDSVEVIKDNTTGWNTFIHAISQNNPAYVADDDVMDRLAIGTKTYGQIRGYNPGYEAFLKVDADGYPVPQAKILFEDIEETDYTTVISAPGLDTRFATEKAIVDYVATQAVTPQNNILNWNGTRYLPYANRLGSNPGYAYFYTGASNPVSLNVRLNLEGYLVGASFIARTSSSASAELISDGSVRLTDAGNITYVSANSNETFIYGTKSGNAIPIYIGQSSLTGQEGIIIDRFNTLFNIDMTTVRLNKGTANKYLYLDGSKNITYVDAPAGGVTPVDNILDWDTDAYKPYTSKTASALYTGVTAPDAVATVLNYDGVFRATQLYEGATRVMTTHGTWKANGTLHEVTTSSHAGFCPQLPVFSPSIARQFLRADGTWVDIDIDSAWTRDEGELAVVPSTSTDAVMIRSTSNLGTLTLGETGTLESIVFGIRDLADNQGYTTSIKWFTNGAENNEVLRLGIKGTGTSASAELYTELVNLTLETPVLNLDSDYDYSTAFYTEIRRDYSGAITSRVFNSASTAVTNAYASKIIGVHPSSADYATVNLTVTSKNFAGISGEWEDNGTGYLKHSANLVTGGTIKPALNIGTREGQPIRFFVGGNSDLDFDNTTLRAVINKDGYISLGDHSSIGTDVAKYLLDIITGDIRLTRGEIWFGGTVGAVDADVRLYREDVDILATDDLFKAPQARFGGSTNYAQFEADGTLKFNGNSTYWVDIDFPIIIRTTGPNIPVIGGLKSSLTAPQWAVNDYVVCEGQEMIHAWKEGSEVTWHIHVYTGVQDATNRYLKFRVEYSYANINSALVSTITLDSPELLIPANTPIGTHLVFDIGTLKVPGLKIGAHVKPLLRRIAAVGTAPSANPFCEMLQLHVECDTIGSREITTK